MFSDKVGAKPVTAVPTRQSKRERNISGIAGGERESDLGISEVRSPLQSKKKRITSIPRSSNRGSIAAGTKQQNVQTDSINKRLDKLINY